MSITVCEARYIKFTHTSYLEGVRANLEFINVNFSSNRCQIAGCQITGFQIVRCQISGCQKVGCQIARCQITAQPYILALTAK